MAFIPIDAKADVQGSKKGKLTPAQHAQLNAWCLAQKTGILDCLDKCVAENLTYTASNNFATIVFKKGYVVICGRLVECEAGTEVEVQTPTVGTTTGSIILKYDLSSSKEEEFTVGTKVGSLVQQDLNDNPLTGVYEFELYSYTATPTTVTLSRTGNYVPDIGGKVREVVDIITNNISGTGVVGEGVPPLQGYNKSNGTIEERLTALGFKEGTVSLSVDGTVPNNDSKCVKMGCWIIVKIIGFGGGYIGAENAKKVGTITGIDLSGDITLKEWTATQQYLNDTSWKIVLKKNGDLIVSKTNNGNIGIFAVPYIYQAFTENVDYQPPTNII